MPDVFVAIGSNLDRELRVREAVHALRQRFGELQVSPIYENPAVGFKGSPFFNFVVNFHTRVRPWDLATELHGIEKLCGRDRSSPKFAPRPMDLDLLLYGDEIILDRGLHIPRNDILQYGFVLKPLVDLAGDRRHPVAGRSYAELWAEFQGVGMELRAVELDLL